MNIFRIIMAFILAPLIPAFFICIFPNVFFDSHYDYGFWNLVATLVSYIIIFVVGIPVFMILQYNKLESFRNYLTSGLLVGFILTFPVFLMILDTPKFKTDDLLLLFQATSTILAYAVIISLAFWLIAKKEL